MGNLSTSAKRRTRSRLKFADGGAPAPLFAKATGGTITTDTASLVEHTFTAGDTFSLLNFGLLPVTYTITGTGTFGGDSSSGSTNVTGNVTVTVTSGSVVVAYDPTDFERGHPLGYPSLQAFYDAGDTSSITDAGGGAVSQWNDLSPNARHLKQGTAGSRPLTGTTSQNGLNTISFDGTDDMLLADNFNINLNTSKQATAFMLKCDDRSTNHEGGFLVKSTGEYDFTTLLIQRRIQYSALSIGDGTGSGGGDYNEARCLSDASVTGTYRIHEVAVNAAGNTKSYTIDGTGFTLTTESGSMAPSGFCTAAGTALKPYVGSRLSGTSDTAIAYPWDGKVATIALFSVDLGATERAAVRAWMKARWGTA